MFTKNSRYYNTPTVTTSDAGGREVQALPYVDSQPPPESEPKFTIMINLT